MTKMGIKTEQAKQNILNELSNANIKRMLDKSPTVEPNANYNKSHIYSIDLTETLPYRSVTFNKHVHKGSKWIKYGLVKLIKFRDQFYFQLKQPRIVQFTTS